MGKVVPIGAPSALADALLEIFARKEKYRCDTAMLANLYAPDTVATEYEKLFEQLLNKK
jgi:glycosyltransferase involved in cell wall biosynthesis